MEHVKINPLEEVETKEEVFKKVQTLCLIPDDPSHEPLETLPISTRHYFWTSFWFHERPDSRILKVQINYPNVEREKKKIVPRSCSEILQKIWKLRKRRLEFLLFYKK